MDDRINRILRLTSSSSFSQIFARLARPIQGAFDAEDIRQALLQKAVEGLPDKAFDSDVILARYLHAMASNFATTVLRRQALFKTHLLTLATPDNPDHTVVLANADDVRFKLMKEVYSWVPVLLTRDYFMAACFILRRLYEDEYESIAACFSSSINESWDAESVKARVASYAESRQHQTPLPGNGLLQRLSPSTDTVVELASALAVQGPSFWSDGVYPFGKLRSWAHQVARALKGRLLNEDDVPRR